MTWWQIVLMVLGGIAAVILALVLLAVVLVNFMIWLDLRLHREGPSVFERRYEAAAARKAQREKDGA